MVGPSQQSRSGPLDEELANVGLEFVKVPVESAHWVSPKFVCRVSFQRKGKQGGLFDTELEDLVGIMALTLAYLEQYMVIGWIIVIPTTLAATWIFLKFRRHG